MLLAKDYIILRGIPASCGVSYPIDREPVRVATLLDEKEFNQSGHGMLHQRTVFFEDRVHDWQWDRGNFRYFTRVADKADVLVVFEETEVSFCTQCGAQKAELQSPCDSCASVPC